MKKANPPRDHHFIPAFYLKHWAGSKGKLVEYTRQRTGLYSKDVGPRATGFETDLYTFADLPRETAQHLESAYFQYADRVADKALDVQLKDPTTGWTKELVSAWSRFVLGVHLRHPDAMLELRTGAADVWDQSGVDNQARYEAIRKPSDPVTFDEYLEGKDPLTKHRMHLNLIIKALDNEFICQHINTMNWSVADLSKARKQLLTSDRPVEISALGAPHGLIFMPISPTKLFIAANTLDTFDKIRRQNQKLLVEEVNKAVVRRARRFVWARDESQRPFIEKHMSKGMDELPLLNLKLPQKP